MRGVSVNVNAISENVWKFMVEIGTACMNDAPDKPDHAADQPEQQRLEQERDEDGHRARSRARAACRSPTVRDATLAYIVIIAPMIAPIEKMIEIVVPR